MPLFSAQLGHISASWQDFTELLHQDISKIKWWSMKKVEKATMEENCWYHIHEKSLEMYQFIGINCYQLTTEFNKQSWQDSVSWSILTVKIKTAYNCNFGNIFVHCQTVYTTCLFCIIFSCNAKNSDRTEKMSALCRFKISMPKLAKITYQTIWIQLFEIL